MFVAAVFLCLVVCQGVKSAEARSASLNEIDLLDVPPPLSSAERAHLESFTLPEGNELEEREFWAARPEIDPTGKIPSVLLKKALAYYRANYERIENKNYLSVLDFSQHSSKARFFLIDMTTGKVASLHVAHGEGSDPSDSGFAQRFSNVEGSRASSLGFYYTAETYTGRFGHSLRLDGLSETNSRVRERAVVVHGADYVYDRALKAGRTWGCMAFSWAKLPGVIEKVKGGSLIYAALSSDVR